MADDDFTYRDLRRLHQLEKRSSALAQLRNDFYEKVLGYIVELERLLSEVDSLEKRRLVEDELKNAKKTFKEVYEIREKKIVLAALSKVRGGNPDVRNLLEDELNLFETLVDVLEKTRSKTLFGENSEKVSDKSTEDEDDAEEEVNEEYADDRMMVLVKKDLPTFVGVNMKKYSLRENDVVSLPSSMGETLKSRGAAEKIR